MLVGSREVAFALNPMYSLIWKCDAQLRCSAYYWNCVQSRTTAYYHSLLLELRAMRGPQLTFDAALSEMYS